MKRMFGVVVVLLILYIAIQVIYSYTVGRQVSIYKLVVDGREYQIKETFTSRHRSVNHNTDDQTNYYYEITNNNELLFSFKLLGNNNGVKQLVKDLKVYSDDTFTCAYPIFKTSSSNIDVMCNGNGKSYLYGSIEGTNTGIDAFVAKLKALGYRHPSWDSVDSTVKAVGPLNIYANNIASDQSLTTWAYNGFYRVTNRGENFYRLNTDNRYDPLVTSMVNQYYVIPDFKIKDGFNQVFVTNLISGSMETLDLGVNLPYTAFVQGVVDNIIYIIDPVSKLQYTVDIYNKQISVVGDSIKEVKYYSNGEWGKISMAAAINNKVMFTNTSAIPDSLKTYNPISIGEVGGETDGYYYLYIRENNGINVYRVDKQNVSVLTLLFTVPSVNCIKYVSNDIYFTSGDTLYSYRTNLGLRPLIKYNDFSSNNTNLYNVYVGE